LGGGTSATTKESDVAWRCAVDVVNAYSLPQGLQKMVVVYIEMENYTTDIAAPWTGSAGVVK
jgi:hypothetical protein